MTDYMHPLQQRITTTEQNAVFAQNDGDRRRVEIGLHQCDSIRWSGIWESRSMKSVTATCFCHNSLSAQTVCTKLSICHHRCTHYTRLHAAGCC